MRRADVEERHLDRVVQVRVRARIRLWRRRLLLREARRAAERRGLDAVARVPPASSSGSAAGPGGGGLQVPRRQGLRGLPHALGTF